MRRTLAIVAGVVAVLGMLAPPVLAQPVPKVTITGLFDQVTAAGSNFYDGNYTRTGDKEWYARTRFRPDFEFAVGRTKAVLGLEIDLTWGQTGPTSGGPGKAIVTPGTTVGASNATQAGQKAGSTSDSTLNTDVAGVIEIKWLYTEFDLTGKDSLLPFIPVLTVARAGLQPFATLANYKASYAAGDFPGISAITTFTPEVKTALAYVMVEDEIATVNRTIFNRGNDFAVIASPEITPFKGLDIKPLFSYFHAEGTTNGNARRAANNLTTPGSNIAGNAATGGGTGSLAGGLGRVENRYTVGLDARWRSGPFSLDPTFYYQWGDRDVIDTVDGLRNADMSSWLADVIFGFQAGPLLLEARGIYSRGNKAGDNLNKKIKYYEPLDLDTNYYINWAQILALGVDYFNGGGASNGLMSTNVGYDRYGRAQFGVRATYSVTPALSFYGIVSPTWTAEKVDTDTGIASNGIRTIVTGAGSFTSGDSRYIGTEGDLGLTWRFAANTAFDLVGGYLFAGSALDTTECVGTGPTCDLGGVTGGGLVKKDAKDAWTVAARVRLSF